MQHARQAFDPSSYRLLVVRVKRCLREPHRFRFFILEKDGSMAGSSTETFASEAEAFRAGNAAARTIRRKG